MKRFIRSLRFVFKPRFWMQNYPTDSAWDHRIQLLISDAAEVEFVTEYTLKLGDVLIWVSNYPYAYGHKVDTRIPQNLHVLPSRLTRYDLHNYLRLAMLEARDK